MDTPLTLYVHIPWCERKCPYCDFNSHPLRGALPAREYTQAL
ncbi:MAG: YggW family oxidoreductase, partial [Arenicellales bacterium]